MPPLTDYPAVICTDCAEAAGGSMPAGHMATWTVQTCPVCETQKATTELDDFHWCRWPSLEAINRVRAAMG